MSFTTIKIRKETKDKLDLIKHMNNYGSLDKVINQLIPQAINENYQFHTEKPAFTLLGKTNSMEQIIKVGYDELRKSQIGDKWQTNDEIAIILFKDEYGALIRFITNGLSKVEYYHYI